MSLRRRHLLAVLALPAASVAALVVYLLVVRGRLPDQVAVHWGLGGQPDGFAAPETLLVVFPGAAIAVGALMAVISLTSAASIAGRPLPGMANGVVWFLAALAVATTAIQLDGDTGAELPGWAIAAALAAGLAGWAVAMVVAGDQGGPPESMAPAPAEASRLDLPAGHTAVWSGRAPTAPVPMVVAFGVAALAAVLAVVVSWGLLIILVPVAVLVAATSSYRITVGPGAVDVSGALFGFPRLRIPLATIARADVGEVDAWSFGGWGIRVGTNRESAVITRSGPALVVTRTDGAVLRISLDEPADAAATITTLLDRRGERSQASSLDGPC
jgi:hypothetical protein